LQQYKPGARVNIECDVFAKYLEKMLSSLAIPAARG
jgi:riboflavin synthase alpha subunit